MIEGIIIFLLSFGMSMNAIAIRLIIKRLVRIEKAEIENKEHFRTLYNKLYRGVDLNA